MGLVQGFFLEKLPESIFTLTRDQVRQLKADNIESPPSPDRITIADLIARYPPPMLGSSVFDPDRNLQDPKSVLKSVYDILPLYVGRKSGEERENGKRKHGRGGDLNESLEKLKKMSAEAGIKDGQPR
jgi:NADH dehydrogenase